MITLLRRALHSMHSSCLAMHQAPSACMQVSLHLQQAHSAVHSSLCTSSHDSGSSWGSDGLPTCSRRPQRFPRGLSRPNVQARTASSLTFTAHLSTSTTGVTAAGLEQLNQRTESLYSMKSREYPDSSEAGQPGSSSAAGHALQHRECFIFVPSLSRIHWDHTLTRPARPCIAGQRKGKAWEPGEGGKLPSWKHIIIRKRE